MLRGPALAAGSAAVARVLHEAGYQSEASPTRPHPDKTRRFERPKPNQLWQTDLFTFVLKRQNRRLYLVAFMDDHSRFLVGYGLHASASTALVLEVVRAAIASYGPPEEILTDNGPQYVTWRGKSQFSRELEVSVRRITVAAGRKGTYAWARSAARDAAAAAKDVRGTGGLGPGARGGGSADRGDTPRARGRGDGRRQSG